MTEKEENKVSVSGDDIGFIAVDDITGDEVIGIKFDDGNLIQFSVEEDTVAEVRKEVERLGLEEPLKG